LPPARDIVATDHPDVALREINDYYTAREAKKARE